MDNESLSADQDVNMEDTIQAPEEEFYNDPNDTTSNDRSTNNKTNISAVEITSTNALPGPSDSMLESMFAAASADPDFKFSDDSGSSSDEDENSSTKEAAEDTFQAQQQKDLDLLATTIQAQYELQPLSTQLILTKESAQLFKEYSRHGSHARLSESIMGFLEGGDVVMRKATRVVTERRPFRNSTTGAIGYMNIPVEKEGLERAKLQFTPIPPCVSQQAENKSHQREVPSNVQGNLNLHSPRIRKMAVPKSLKERLGVGGRERPDPAVDGFPLTRARDSKVESAPAIDRKCHEDLDEPYSKEYSFEERRAVRLPDSHISNAQTNQQDVRKSSSNVPAISYSKRNRREPPIATLESLAPRQPQLIHTQDSTMTTDPETHALLTDPNTLPFHPVDLELTLPPGTSFPFNALESINNILHLHDLAAHDLLRYLTLKYTPRPSPIPSLSSTPLAAPPLALFRLASASLFSSQVSSILQPTTSHNLFLTPTTRTLLRDFHDAVQGGNLNHAEVEILTRACRLSDGGVEVFWRERAMERRGWNALRVWRRARELERVRAAKALGLY